MPPRGSRRRPGDARPERASGGARRGSRAAPLEGLDWLGDVTRRPSRAPRPAAARRRRRWSCSVWPPSSVRVEGREHLPRAAATSSRPRSTVAGSTRWWRSARCPPSRGPGSSAPGRRPSGAAGARRCFATSAASCRSGVAVRTPTSTSTRRAPSSTLAARSSSSSRAPWPASRIACTASVPASACWRCGSATCPSCPWPGRQRRPLSRQARRRAGSWRRSRPASCSARTGRRRRPTPGTRDEIRLARLVTDRLAERLQAAVTELYPGTVDPPERAAPLALAAWALLMPRPVADPTASRARPPGAGRPAAPARGLRPRRSGLLGFRLELVGAEHLPRDGDGPPGRRLDRGRAAARDLDRALRDARPAARRAAPGLVRRRPRDGAFVAATGRVPPPRRRRAHPSRAAVRRHSRTTSRPSARWSMAAPSSRSSRSAARRCRRVRRGRIAPGIGYFGLRSGAPIVPMVFGGTHELYRGRRIQHARPAAPSAPPTWPPRPRSRAP